MILYEVKRKNEIPIDGEYILEMMSCIDVGGHDVSEDSGVLAVESHCSVEDVEEEVDVTRVGKITGHRFEHTCY